MRFSHFISFLHSIKTYIFTNSMGDDITVVFTGENSIHQVLVIENI